MSNPQASRRRNGCPLCGAPVGSADAPFCGPRCRDRDLLNWLGDGYRLPARPTSEDEADFDGEALDRPATPSL